MGITIFSATILQVMVLIVFLSSDGDVVGMCKIAAQELVHRYPIFQITSGRIIDDFEGSWIHFC